MGKPLDAGPVVWQSEGDAWLSRLQVPRAPLADHQGGRTKPPQESRRTRAVETQNQDAPEGGSRVTPAEKRCTKCGVVKPLEKFYVDSNRKDGRRSHCGACCLEDVKKRQHTEEGRRKRLEWSRTEKSRRADREYRKSENGRIVHKKAKAKYRKSEHGREKTRARAKDEKNKEYMRKWRMSPTGSESHRKSISKYQKSKRGKEAEKKRRQKEPWKEDCRTATNHAVGSGKLPSASDISCSEASPECSGRHEYHHDSYRKEDWLKVRCLCLFHHRKWHQENGAIPYEEPTRG